MLIVYTGDGKGKTTASIGLLVRAVGAGKTVKIIKFMKGFESSEDKILENIGVKVCRTGMKRFVDPKNPKDEDRSEAEKGLSLFLSSNEEVIVLDEINVALSFGLLDENKVRDVLEKFSKTKDRVIVATGRNAPEWMIRIADIVTEMKKVRHWFDDGIPAIKGVDF